MKHPVPTSQTRDRSHLGRTSNRARGQKGPSASAAAALHPSQALILLCCQDSTLQEHSWHSSSTSSHCNQGFVRAALLQGGHPARLGVGSFPGLSLQLLMISKQVRCLQERVWPFPNPAKSRAFASKGSHNSALQIGQQVEPWLTAQFTPDFSQPVGMLHASGVFLTHLPKSGPV